MPLLPVGIGLIAVGVLTALQASSAWIALAAFGAIIVAARRLPLALLWTGRIPKLQAAFAYAAILPIAFIVITLVTRAPGGLGRRWGWRGCFSS